MKKLLILVCCLLLPISMMAQRRTGDITGTIHDTEGNPLPGVSVTLSGATIAPMTSTTSAEGKFRFLSLFPGSDYVLKCELQGFKTQIETGVIVNVAKASEITIKMEVGALAEQVTVIAQTPIIQAKKTQITHTVSYEMLQELPSARDPWVILQMTPGVQMDRENIGGVESGQQSSYFSKGTTTQEWTMDGMQITDRNSGGSPGYFDFDMFEELNISTGTLDVEHRDPGTVVNIVTSRGGNKISLGARFFWTDQNFQAKISRAEMTEIGLLPTQTYNQAVDIKDFGFTAGGPFVKDKAWWWLGYGIQQVLTLNAVNTRDDTYLNNYTGKLNFQIIPTNRLELLYVLGDKKKFGRSSSSTFPPGWEQGSKFHFGNPTWKIQDEQMIGNDLFLSARIGLSNPGFGMKPENDLSLAHVAFWNVEKAIWNDSQTYFYSNRPHPYDVFQAQYFNDNLLGMAHEIKVGFEINPNSRTYEGGWPGNVRYYNSYYYETSDWSGNGSLGPEDIVFNNPAYLDTRGNPINVRYLATGQNDFPYSDGTRRYAAYLSDVITAGRFNINIGLRFDRAYNYVNPEITRGLFATNATGNFAHYADIALQVFTPEAVAKIISIQGDTHQPDLIKPPKISWYFSPRLGVTYDIFGDGKTIAKLAYTMYPGGGLGTAYNMPFGIYGWLDFWGIDFNGDGKYALNELFWTDVTSVASTPYRVFDDAGNFIGNTARELNSYWGGTLTLGGQELSPSTTSVDTSTWKPTQTHEFNVSIDREIFKDFGVNANVTYKFTDRYSWTQAYYPAAAFPTLSDPNHLRNKNDYIIVGYVPDVNTTTTGVTFDPGEAKGRPYYNLINADYTGPTSYSRTVMMDPARKNTFLGGELVFTKRLSNKWMANAAFTLQTQKAYYGTNGYLNPTNQWAVEGQQYAFTMGGTSGKTNRDFFSRWTVQMSGLYQLPYDISVSASLSAHEGTFYQTAFTIQDRTIGGAVGTGARSWSATMPTTSMDNRQRSPTVINISGKLEKMLRLGQDGRLYFSVDFFNVANLHTVLRRYDISQGSFRYTGAPTAWTPFSYAAPGATSGVVNDILNPFVFRLGTRVSF